MKSLFIMWIDDCWKTWKCMDYCASREPVRTNLWRYYFNFSSDQTQTHIDRVNVLDKSEANFNWIRQQMKNCPIDSHCKYRRLCILTSKVEGFLQWESIEKFFIYCPIQMKFRLRVRLKRWNNRGEFEWARSKNNIAENLFSLAPETHSSFMWMG